MLSQAASRTPSAVEHAFAASDGEDGGNPRAKPVSAPGNGDGSNMSRADAAVTDDVRSPAAATAPLRSILSLHFPSAAPAYDVSPVDAPLQGAPPRPPAPFTSALASTTAAAAAGSAAIATAPTSGAPVHPSALRPASPATAPHRRGSSRPSSNLGERASVLERRATEAQATLEMVNQVAGEIAGVDEQVAQLERELQGVQRAVESGGSNEGKRGEALAVEHERLTRKEQVLREEKRQLREGWLVLLRSRCDLNQRRVSEVASRPRRIALIETRAHPNDPDQARQARRRLSHIEDVEHRRWSMSVSSSAASEIVPNGGGPELLDDHSSVQIIYKPEEDPRLVVRMEAFNLPVLVGTLLSGFTLVLFDVATTDLARRLAVLAFALEISSSTVLCWIMFHGQQLYSRSSDMEQNTRPFLRSTFMPMVLSLATFSVGVATFVVSFLVEASEEMGEVWLATFAVILCPTALAASMFPASTAKLRRLTLTPQRSPALSE
eukprot:g9169.t1